MKILLSILLFFVSFVSFSQTTPQRNNVPWYEYTRKLSVGQRFAPPTDTLSYPPGAINRDTTGLLAFAPNGNLYKLWNGVWSLVGGAGSNVQILGDSAIVVDDDTLIIRPIQFETDLAPEYAFQDGDTIRLYPRQYIQDSVLITKSGDTLFFPNGDTAYVGIDTLGITRDGDTLRLTINGVPGAGVYSAERPYINQGNSFGDTARIGSNDAFPVAIETSGRDRMIIDTSGRVKLFSSETQETPVLGSELLSSSGWTSTNWTGDFTTGFTHTTGNTTALTNSLAAVIGQSYIISIEHTGWTAGTFTISFGGQTSSPFSVSATVLIGFGPTATTTGTLSITPTSTFDGALFISVKQILQPSTHLLAVYDQLGNISVSMRSGVALNGNMFLGGESGRFHTNRSYYNAAFGFASMRSITTGKYNAAGGYSALGALTTGDFNTAFGYGAGTALITGLGNTYVGYNAGRRATTGGSNVGMGNIALDAVTTGNRNVALGTQALQLITTSSDNTATGTLSGGGFTSATSVSAFGYRAGRFLADGSTTFTTATNSLYLGSESKGSANSVTNENVIGYNAIGAGSNTVTIGDNNITASYLKGSVVIGKTWTTTPPTAAASAVLEVESTTKGFLPPRMTATQASAISSPAEGLLVYVTDTNGTFTSKGWWGYNGSAWEKLNN